MSRDKGLALSFGVDGKLAYTKKKRNSWRMAVGVVEKEVNRLFSKRKFSYGVMRMWLSPRKMQSDTSVGVVLVALRIMKQRYAKKPYDEFLRLMSTLIRRHNDWYGEHYDLAKRLDVQFQRRLEEK